MPSSERASEEDGEERGCRNCKLDNLREQEKDDPQSVESRVRVERWEVEKMLTKRSHRTREVVSKVNKLNILCEISESQLEEAEEAMETDSEIMTKWN